MLEKLLLAATLTLALSLFTQLSRSSPPQTAQQANQQNNIVLILSQRHK